VAGGLASWPAGSPAARAHTCDAKRLARRRLSVQLSSFGVGGFSCWITCERTMGRRLQNMQCFSPSQAWRSRSRSGRWRASSPMACRMPAFKSPRGAVAPPARRRATDLPRRARPTRKMAPDIRALAPAKRMATLQPEGGTGRRTRRLGSRQTRVLTAGLTITSRCLPALCSMKRHDLPTSSRTAVAEQAYIAEIPILGRFESLRRRIPARVLRNVVQVSGSRVTVWDSA